MAAKAFLALAAAKRTSAAIVFVDYRSAFYSVLTEEVLGSILSEAGRSHALGAIGMLPAEVAVFEQTFLAQPPLLQQHGLSGSWCAAMADWHRRCWFAVPGGTNVVVHLAGARPGDPLADMVANLCFLLVNREFGQELDKLGMLIRLPLAGRRIFSEQPPTGVVELTPYAFIDDTCVPIWHEDGRQLLADVEVVASTFMAVAAKHGLRLSFEANKTEAIVQLAGPWSGEAQLHVDALDREGEAALLPLSAGGFLRLVPQYRHLGAQVGPRAWLSLEVSARRSAAAAATASLAKSFLNKKKVPRAARVHVAAALVHSRLTYLAGSWPSLSGVQCASFSAAYCRPFRVIAGVHVPPEDGMPHDSNQAVLDHLLVVPPQWALILARLRLAPRVSNHGPAYLHALLQSDGGRPWIEALAASTHALSCMVPDKVGTMPDPRVRMAPWEDLWMHHPAQWVALCKLVQQRVLSRPSLAQQVLEGCGLRGGTGPRVGG
jgi:hypothetical protein